MRNIPHTFYNPALTVAWHELNNKDRNGRPLKYSTYILGLPCQNCGAHLSAHTNLKPFPPSGLWCIDELGLASATTTDKEEYLDRHRKTAPEIHLALALLERVQAL